MHRGTGLRSPHCLKNYFHEGTVQIHTGYQCRTWFRNALLNLEIHEMCFWGRQESLDWQLFPTSELQKWPSILCTHRTGSLNCLKPEFETRTSGSLETGRSLAVRFPTAWWDWRQQNKDPSAQPGFPCCAGLLWALSWSWYPSQHLLSCVSLPVCHQCCVLRPAHRTESTLWKCSHEFNTEWQLLIWQVTAWKSSAKNQINFASPSPDYHQEA